MHQDEDGFSRTPKSSSSSNPSGTQALRVTIEPEPFETASVAVLSDTQLELAASADSDFVAAEPSCSLSPQPDEHPAGSLAPEAPAAVIETEPMAVAEPEPVLESWAAPSLANGLAESAEDCAPAAMTPQLDAIEIATASITSQIRDTEELRRAVRERLADNAGKRERALVLIEEMSQTVGAMMDEARHDAALIGQKLMEFVQANFETNFKLAKDYAGARSVPEIVNVHTTYVQRQIELLGRQAEEFRTLTSDIAAKKADKFQARAKA
jgi:hypothetical protein